MILPAWCIDHPSPAPNFTLRARPDLPLPPYREPEGVCRYLESEPESLQAPLCTWGGTEMPIPRPGHGSMILLFRRSPFSTLLRINSLNVDGKQIAFDAVFGSGDAGVQRLDYDRLARSRPGRDRHRPDRGGVPGDLRLPRHAAFAVLKPAPVHGNPKVVASLGISPPARCRC